MKIVKTVLSDYKVASPRASLLTISAVITLMALFEWKPKVDWNLLVYLKKNFNLF